MLSITYITSANSTSLELSISSKPLLVCMAVAHTHTHTHPHISHYHTHPALKHTHAHTHIHTHTAGRAGGCVLRAGVGWWHGLGQQGQSHHPCRRCSSAWASLPRLRTSPVGLDMEKEQWVWCGMKQLTVGFVGIVCTCLCSLIS